MAQLSVRREEKVKITCKVNGKEYNGIAESRTLLVHFLRDELSLTGTHIGCDTGHCGACTILLNGKSVKSCMVLAVRAQGAEVTTVEGLADGDTLHPIQEAFRDNHGLQCGYCTPGILMSAYFLLQRNPNPTEAEIVRGIDGNLCRCTGYINIIKSVKAAAREMQARSGTPSSE